MVSYSLAVIKIVYGAVFTANDFPGAEQAVKEITDVRMDALDLFKYANAISHNKVPDYYETLCLQLRQVILERDLARLTVRHNATCKAIPNGKYTQLIGRAVRVKIR